MDEKSKILIVEDNLKSRKTLSDILKAKGFSTITADSGREALDRLKEAIPAVALIDLKLEDMSGLEVMKGTKKRFPGTECIIITGYASKASAIEAVNMGAYAYVEKPYDMEQLLAMIRRAVEKREVEETLKDSEARYKTLFEGASQGILIVDVETKNFQYANAALCKMLGYTDEELKRMSVSDIHPEEELEHVVSEFESQTRGEKSLSADICCLRKDGAIIYADINTAKVLIDGRECNVGFFSETTERKQAVEKRKKLEAKLQQAQKMESIGTLAGGIAHDFNNILSSIIGFTELALDEVEKGTSIEDSLQEVYTAGNRAKDLVKQILSISRHDEREIKPIQVIPLIKEALKMLRSTIPTSIEFKENICSGPLVVQADPTQLHQVVVNLATNAKQAMADGSGVLEVVVDAVSFDSDVKTKYPDLQPGNFARITVSDTGSGIPEKDMKKIFEPYFTTKEKGEGTGLGLSVIHGIVKSHNGHITVYSELGKGTTFHVYLPLVKKAAAELQAHTAEFLPMGTEHILLIDDEAPIIKLQQHNLERLGYTVTARLCSVEALEAFRVSPDNFDLVITDMTMPNMTGDKLTQEVKAIRSGVPVILCTGFSEQISGDGENLDIDGFLMKPVDKEKMAKMVRKVLNKVKG